MGRLYRYHPNRRGPVVPQASQPPYLSYWIHPVNQPLRNRIPKRQPPQSPFWNVAPYRPFQTNFDMERLPAVISAQTNTSNRWIDGTAAGSEGTPYGWAIPSGVSATAGFDTSTFHGGTASMKLSNPTTSATATITTFRLNGPTTGSLPTEAFPILPNTQYVITAWIMTNNVPTNGAFVEFRQYSAAASNLSTSTSNKLSGTVGWTQVSVSVTTNASAAWGGILLRNSVAGNVCDAWFDDITVAVLPNSFQEPVNQPLKNRVPKRLQLRIPNPPLSPLSSQAPYLSYWKKPVNQPQRNNARQRQQPTQALQEPFYGIPTAAATPSVASWIHPTNQPLRNRVKGQRQLPASEVPPTIGSQAPYVTYWKQPTNQPLKSRVSKRQQPRANAPPVAPQGSTAPYLSYWIQPVNQPLRSRISKRQQLPRIKPLSGFAPTLETWKKAVNQPYKGQLRRRQQPAPPRNLYAATASAPVAPVVSSWVHPVNQRLRAKPQYRQAALRLQPLLNLASAPATSPIWVPDTDPTGTWLPDDGSAAIWVPDADPTSTWNPE